MSLHDEFVKDLAAINAEGMRLGATAERERIVAALEELTWWRSKIDGGPWISREDAIAIVKGEK